MSESSSTTRVTIPERLAPRTQACLVGIYPTGPGMGCLYPISSTPLLLGRDEDCNVCVPDQAVSRRHARVQPTVDGYYVLDLQSTNGTFVNEERVEKHKLQDGDYIRIGGSIYRFLDRDNVEAAYHEEIYSLTIVDALTEVHNRRYLIEFLGRELARSARYQRPVALVLIDVDRFKAINDEMGHLAGDATLRELAALLRPCARPGDVLARYGGEEFALALVETNLDAGVAAAEEIRRRVLAHTFRFGDRTYTLTVSLGVAAHSDDQPVDALELIRQADCKLFEAKRTGRNRTVA